MTENSKLQKHRESDKELTCQALRKIIESGQSTDRDIIMASNTLMKIHKVIKDEKPAGKKKDSTETVNLKSDFAKKLTTLLSSNKDPFINQNS